MSDRQSGLGAALRKSRYILREEGLVTWADRLARIALVKLRRTLQDKKENTARWQELKGSYSGQRAFLVGNGPSLNQTPMHLLKGEQVMCFNRFYLMFERLAWRPSLYAISDDRVAFDIADEVNSIVLPTVDAAFFPDIHPYNVDFRRVIEARENVYWMHLDRLDFSDELPWAGMNKTVANVGLQVLAYLGFNPIYLIGVDMSYSKPASIVEESSRDWTSTGDDDPNHFDPRYFGAGRKYHAPFMDETRERYVRAAEFFGERGVEIVNAGVGGELDVFPRVDFRGLFDGGGRADEMALIEEAVRSADSVISSGVDFSAIPETSGFDSDLSAAWLADSAIVPGFSDVLRTHFIFGPTRAGRYLTVARRSGPAW